MPYTFLVVVIIYRQVLSVFSGLQEQFEQKKVNLFTIFIEVFTVPTFFPIETNPEAKRRRLSFTDIS